MTDTLGQLRAANPVPEARPFTSAVSARITASVLAHERREPPLRRLARALGRSRTLAATAAVLLLAGGTAAAVVELNDQASAPPAGGLSRPAGLTGANGYRFVLVPNLSGGAVGWCLTTELATHFGTQNGSTCDRVQWPGRTIVAVNAGSGGQLAHAPVFDRATHRVHLTYTSVAYVAFVTTAQVAAVRLSPTLTIRTRSDAQLPDNYRLAAWIRQSVHHYSAIPHPRRPRTGSPRPLINLVAPAIPDPSRAVALDGRGRSLTTAPPATALLSDAASFWRAQPSRGVSRQQTRHAAPPGACEINTSALRGGELFSGSVVQHVQGFPTLAGRTFLSCAETQFSAHIGVNAAILLDAQHPGIPPEAIPGATPVRPGIVNERLTANQALTARRVGNAWLAIEAGGTLHQRIDILDALHTCVRLAGATCPAT